MSLARAIETGDLTELPSRRDEDWHWTDLRGLIREMLKDSAQLATLKGKVARDDGKQVHDKVAAPADHKNADSANAAAGAKSSDEKGSNKETKRPGKSAHTMKAIPGKPAADLEDVRRSTGVI